MTNAELLINKRPNLKDNTTREVYVLRPSNPALPCTHSFTVLYACHKFIYTHSFPDSILWNPINLY